jgi:hypothetical protein
MKIDLNLLTEMVEVLMNEQELADKIMGYVSEWVVYDYLNGIERNSFTDFAQQDSRLKKIDDSATDAEKAHAFEVYKRAKDNLSRIKLPTYKGTLATLREQAGKALSPPSGGTDKIDVQTPKMDLHVKYEEDSSVKDKRLFAIQRASHEFDRGARGIWEDALKYLARFIVRQKTPNAQAYRQAIVSGTPGPRNKVKGSFIDHRGMLHKPDELKSPYKRSNDPDPRYKDLIPSIRGVPKKKEVAVYLKPLFVDTKKMYQNTIKEFSPDLVKILNQKGGFSDRIKSLVGSALYSATSPLGADFDYQIAFQPAGDVSYGPPEMSDFGMGDGDFSVIKEINLLTGKVRDSLFVRVFKDGTVTVERVHIPKIATGKGDISIEYEESGQGIKGFVKVVPTDKIILNVEFRTDGDSHPPQVKTGAEFQEVMEPFTAVSSS